MKHGNRNIEYIYVNVEVKDIMDFFVSEHNISYLSYTYVTYIGTKSREVKTPIGERKFSSHRNQNNFQQLLDSVIHTTS